jgi:hypothetical protein
VPEAAKEGMAYLDQGADNTEGGETKVFKRTGLGCRVEERV